MALGQEFLRRCPVCERDPGTDLAAEIDSAGAARCRSCGNRVDKPTLYAYWDRENAKLHAGMRESAASLRSKGSKKWWQFWK